VQANDRAYTAALSGATQTASIPGTRWQATLSMPAEKLANRPALEAFLAKCRREHRIALWNLARPTPLGTINQSGVTLSVAAAQFATSLTLTGCGANTTLKAGDMLGFSNQLLMAADDATASAGGVMTVNLTHELRYAQSVGAALTLSKPTALFIQKNASSDFPRSPGYYPAMTIELVEVFA
jgi:hypothetical protein